MCVSVNNKCFDANSQFQIKIASHEELKTFGFINVKQMRYLFNDKHGNSLILFYSPVFCSRNFRTDRIWCANEKNFYDQIKNSSTHIYSRDSLTISICLRLLVRLVFLPSRLYDRSEYVLYMEEENNNKYDSIKIFNQFLIRIFIFILFLFLSFFLWSH